jgi:hypothetical protein
MREKVTDSWRWNGNGVTKKLYATFAKELGQRTWPKSLAEELAAPAANSGGALRDGRAEGNGPPLKLCRRIAKKGSDGAWPESGFFILAML